VDKTFFVLASVFGGLAVALGAFGSHGLSGRLSADLLNTYEIAVRYQFYHALALIGVVVALGRWPQAGLLTWAGWLFVVGILIFSGSLYLLVFSGVRWLGAITPIGGVAMIAGWALLAWSAWRG
jgi:uncharacterized membrane protein YgdD (TMEM256/DUF423 family)